MDSLVHFRLASVDDASLLSRTRQAVWGATYRGIYPDVWIDDYDFAQHLFQDEARIASPGNIVYLAMVGSNCVGYFYFGHPAHGSYKDFSICLNALYFLPEYQHCGLGKRAFSIVKAECLRRGEQKFFCGCNLHNHSARGFYEHLGGKVGMICGGHENPAEDQLYYEFTIGENK